MIEDPDTGVLRPFDFSHLLARVPKLQLLDYDIDTVSFSEPIDSSDMSPVCWAELSEIIADRYDHYDGFVILHGTDTMAYTASALSFMLEGLDKPVIITGSQLPIGEVRTDGEENLITAVQIAAAVDSDGKPTVREVAILFEDYLWRGNRTSKRSSDNFNAFKSNNYPALAQIGLDIQFNHMALLRQTSTQLRIHPRMDTSVMFVDVFPGLTPSTLNHLLSTPGIRGVVLRTFGTGNAPTASWFIDAIRNAIEERGLLIVSITQCASGAVKRRYLAGDKLTAAGVMSGGDLTAEAAITKMMHLLAQDLSPEELRNRFATSICGEMTVTHVPH